MSTRWECLALWLAIAFICTAQSSSRRRLGEVSRAEYVDATSADDGEVVLDVSLRNVTMRNATAPYLYGLMFEDINHSGDGGIYAELLTNRAFQGSDVKLGQTPGLDGDVIVQSENPRLPTGPVLTGWQAIGNVRLSLDKLHPLSDSLPTAMQIDIPKNATGEVGFANHGWWGMDVSPQNFTVSFYVLANAPRKKNSSPTDFNISLRSNTTGEIWATTTAKRIDVPTVDYYQINATIVNTKTAPNTNNTFVITMNATQVAGQTFYFSMFSLFPETFKGRKNGLRKEIAQAFYDMKPKFLRFPGGNNLEGISTQTRWKWFKTIGPLKDRPGRPGDWNYYNTDGLGLLEYLQWCEDMEIEPVLAIYAGFSLDVFGQEGTSYPSDQMRTTILKEALDELEYCMGNASTTYGALRAIHGHPEPFSIKFIEIGNEDWFSDTYPERWEILYGGLKKAYPNITYISTTFNEHKNYTIKLPPGTMWDTHHYEEPQYFLRNFNFYDNWQNSTNNTDVGVLLGEYSVYQVNTPSGIINWGSQAPVDKDAHVTYPRMISAIAEGVYALGGERNPSVVKMSSYAPSLQNLNGYQWTPNMIVFDAGNVVLSPSYWQQWLFARYRGKQTLPVTNSKGDFNPLFWAASVEEGEQVVYVKVINAGAATVPLTVNIDSGYSGVNGTILTSNDIDDFNFFGNKTVVVPKPLVGLDADGLGTVNGTFKWDVPRWSITVLQFNTGHLFVQ
ncbi:glycoside hydrolase [Tothia fuscella]|uniref:non-reducing end alpha-L-arabinofuranosidase n=1 Tax=Tothia fuscella TaxID=1048955 RepID=A0A9P4U057_9PEZI|nr:glycoside hydrolase [Tothia fuscella]